MPRLDERTLDGLADAGRWLGYQQLQHTAEFKDGSIAVHWRGLSDSEAEDLRSRVLLGWRLIAEQSGLDLLEFDGGIEIRASGADKGGAVRILLSEIGPDAPVAYLGDVFVLESHRGRGLSKWMMKCIIQHPALQNLRRWILLTRDAHGLYSQFGFTPVKAPERYMELHQPNVYELSRKTT